MTLSFSLDGRRALVTGAARGLGREIAKALAEGGARVCVAGREQHSLDAVVQEIEKTDGRARALAFDMADEAETEAAIQDLEADGGLDILVNAAGDRDRRTIDALDATAFRRLLDINLVGAFTLSRAVAPQMRERGGGRIIHVTSIAGHIARAGDAVYTASKAGLTGMVKALAAELGPDRTTVNAVAPGYFATEANQDMVADPAIADWLSKRTSLGRWGEPKEIAGAVRFLASDEAAYITGHVLAVDGGYLSHF